MSPGETKSVAVVGAGIAGAACARALFLAGYTVHVFDKSRGPGGRLATRRVEWADQAGRASMTRFDHGAIAITARSRAFQTFVDLAVSADWLTVWNPALAADSLPLDDARLYLPTPDMPSLCRRLLEKVSVKWSFTVDSLHKSPLGWQVEAAGERYPAHFDVLVLALPPVQAVPLLNAYRRDWAEHASAAAMEPCWTLMGIADVPDFEKAGELARLPTGPLAWVLRNDARPGRVPALGQAHWVAHARADWSRLHLEQPAAWVQQQMHAALDDWLGRTVSWQHSVVHRWRYALPPAQAAVGSEWCWWDAAQGLGVCGDFLGGAGVEGAWLSAQSLSAALLHREPTAASKITPSAAHPSDHAALHRVA